MTELEEIVLGLDELEAIRLVDFESLSQEEAGARMGISRGTIGRLLEHGRHTLADALLHGKALHIEGGPVVEGRKRGRRGARCCEPANADIVQVGARQKRAGNRAPRWLHRSDTRCRDEQLPIFIERRSRYG